MAANPRRKSIAVNVGSVKVGGSNPIVVQSMTNTDTADVAVDRQPGDGAGQRRLRAGARHRQHRRSRAPPCPRSSRRSTSSACRVPIIGDFHYNGHLLLKKYPDCARALAKYRINPGNVNIGKKHDDNFRTMIEAAIEYDRPVRIGVNWGSLDGALLTRMMDENNLLAEPLDADDGHAATPSWSAPSNPRKAAEHYGLAPRPHHPQRQSQRRAGPDRVYRMLAAECDYALHLGLTEAGLGSKGIVAIDRGAIGCCCRKASAIPFAPR